MRPNFLNTTKKKEAINQLSLWIRQKVPSATLERPVYDVIYLVSSFQPPSVSKKELWYSLKAEHCLETN